MTSYLYARMETLGYTESEIEAAEDALMDLYAVLDLENFRRMLEILRTTR